MCEVFEEPPKALGELTIKDEAAHQLAQRTEFGLVTVFDEDFSGSIKPSRVLGLKYCSMLTLLALGGIALVTAACSEQALPSAPSTAPSMEQSLATSGVSATGAGGPPTIQAAGQGAFREPPWDGPGGQRTFSFSGLAGPGGQSGHAEVFNHENGIRTNIRLDCVRYDDTTSIVVLGGVVTNSNSEIAPVGRRLFFGIRDGGEGRAAGPDQVTRIAEVPPFQECRDLPQPLGTQPLSPLPVPLEFFLTDISHGNVQVRVSE